jgi:ferrous iron transport protein B
MALGGQSQTWFFSSFFAAKPRKKKKKGYFGDCIPQTPALQSGKPLKLTPMGLYPPGENSLVAVCGGFAATNSHHRRYASLSRSGMKELTIALAGNPNAGKSTIFNALTGAHQHVGNWPGKTVEKKEGVVQFDEQQVAVIDLPGTYSLSAYSIEEQVAREFIVKEKPQVIVNVVDASNLERNLYLTAQLLETGIPVIIVLNMLDMADARNMTVDEQKLSQLLGGIPVIPMVARKGKGLDMLKESIATFLVRKGTVGSLQTTLSA